MSRDKGVAADAAALPPYGLSRSASQAKPTAANAGHTPGPWSVEVDGQSGIGRTHAVYVCGAGGWPEGQLARVNVQDGLGEREANARLIAAAPSLLAALEEYTACVAFATNPAVASADILTLKEASDRMRAARLGAEAAISKARTTVEAGQ